MPASDNQADQARRQSVLGIILLALHPLFGITAIIGMLISSMSLKSTEGTVYHSHLKWQMATFWIGLATYIVAFFLWNAFGHIWPIFVAFFFVAYRVSTNLKHWVNEEPINKLF